MDWEQKFAAINALAQATLQMRGPGDWYVETSVEVKNGSILEGRYGNGTSPENAVNSHWAAMLELAADEYLVANAGMEWRRAVKWNGFMWDDVRESDRSVCDTEDTDGKT